MAVLFRFVNPDGTVRLNLDSDSDGLRIQRGLRLGTMEPEFQPLTQAPHPGMIQAGVRHPAVEMFVPVRFAKRQPSIDSMLSLWDQLGNELDRANIIEFRPHGFDQSFLFDTYCSPVPSLFDGTDFDFQEFLQQVDSIPLVIYRHPHARPAVPNAVGFNRDSSAYLPNGELVATDVMRMVDSDAGKAVLVEWGVTNLLSLTQSTDFSAAGYTNNACNVINNVGTAPDGTLTADKVEETATNSDHNLSLGLGDKSGVPQTYSVYAKAGERSWLRLRGLGGTGGLAWFDLAAGEVGTVTGGEAFIDDVGDGWYRCSWWRGAGNVGEFVVIGVATGDNVQTYLGVAGSGIYLWHPMVLDSQPDSSWQIGGTPRLGETLWVSNLPLDRDGGTIEVRVYVDALGLNRSLSELRNLFRVNANAAPEYIIYRMGSPTQLSLYCGASNEGVTPNIAAIPEGWHVFSLRWDPVKAAASIDGIQKYEWANTLGVVTSPNTLHLGTSGGGGEYGGCPFDSIKVSNRPRTNDELAAVGARPLGSDEDTTFFRSFSDVTPGKWV